MGINHNLEKVPNELKSLPQWVLWKLEERNGKPTKVPYQINGHQAKSDDPTTWSTFAKVVATYKRGKYSGIGFMFADNEIVGIDCDHCIENGQITAEGQEWLKRFGSYAEISHSGKGLHVIVRGKIPGERRRNGHFEIYETKRYFALTGNVLQGHENLRENQSAIDEFYQAVFCKKNDKTPVDSRDTPKNHDTIPVPGLALSDEEIIEKASKARNGAKFSRLWNGDTSAYNSASEADLALACLIAFYTKDTTQLERIMGNSALGKREKWQREDYRQKTIAQVLKSVSAQYQKPTTPRTPRREEKEKAKFEEARKRIEKKGREFSKIIKQIGTFKVTDKGIFHEVVHTNKSPTTVETLIEHEKICDDPVIITERLEDIAGQECYVKLTWNGRERIFPQDALLTKNSDILVRAGLRILGSNQKPIGEYFLVSLGEADITRPFSTRNGWFGKKFVKGNQVITTERVDEIGRNANGPSVGAEGDKSLWQETVKRFTNDPQVQILLGASTICPTFTQLGIENFTLHLWQDSSCGKSFLAKLAASMWGKFEDDNGAGLVRSWNSTYVGHEFYFHTLKNIPCFLDESQLCTDQEVVEKTIYQFGNGYGKSRGTKEGELANLKSWRSLLISTGEKRITDSSHMAGLGARTIEIFRRKYEEISETEFRKTYLVLNKNYGMAGVRIIQYFLANQEKIEQKYLEILESLETTPQVKSAIATNDIIKRLLPRWAGIILGAQLNQSLFGFQYDGQAIWQEMLKSFGESQEKPTATLYDTLIEIYLSNKIHFNKRPAKGMEIIEEVKDEVWGFLDVKDSMIYFFPDVLKRELKKRNFVYSQLSLLPRETILRDGQGKNQVVSKYQGKPTRFIAIVLKTPNESEP